MDNDTQAARNVIGVNQPTALDRQLGWALRELGNLQSPYRILGDIVEFGLWVCDASGRLIYNSQSFLDLLGHSFEDAQAIGWTSFLHPEDASETERLWQKCLADGALWDREHRYRGRDGVYKTVLSRGKPVRDVAGDIVMWVGLNLDVTDYRRADQALKESHARIGALNGALQAEIAKGRADRERLDLALAASGVVGVWDGDLLTGKVYGDRHFARIYGVDPAEEAEGKPLGHYFKHMHPNDVEAAAAERARMIAGADEFHNEHRVIRPDGSYIWILARGRLIRDDTGIPIRFLGVSVDITARKQAEARQSFLVTLQDLMRGLTNPDDIFTAAAAHLGHYLGASRIGYGEVQPDGETVVITCGYAADGVPPVNGTFALAAFGPDNLARARQGITFIVNDVQATPRDGQLWDSIGTRAHVSVPLIREGRYAGSFYVSQAKPHHWAPADVALIEEVASRSWDAAQRGRAELKLRESEERARLALESGGLGTWDYYVAEDRVVQSVRHNKIYGYDDASLAPPFAEGLQHIHAEDRDRVAAGMQTILATGTAWRDEFRIIRQDGSTGWVEIRAKPFTDHTGKVIRLLGTIADISERKRAEAESLANAAQFEMFAQAMPNHVWTARPDGTLDWFNDRALAYGGVTADKANGDWLSIVHPDDQSRTAALWTAAVAAGHPYDAELRLRRHDGAYRWHIARAVPLRGEAGRILRWIGTNTDIEEQKNASQALADLNATLESQVQERTAELMAAEESLRQSQKMEAVGQLTGGIAHDFNNLLTGISGSLELLEHRLAQGRLKDLDRYIHMAQGGAKRAATLTHRLLAFSRRQELDPKPTDINQLVDGMNDLVCRTVGPQISLTFIPANESCVTLADPNQLENALLNLCINARDAMPDGGKITIEASTLQTTAAAAKKLDIAAGDYVMLTVSDTGTGMPPEVIARAFDPFFTTKPAGEGTGLGLSMVYGFVRQTGGQAKIISAPGEGTRISLYLPRVFGAQENAEAQPNIAVAARAHAGETVLVVDDDPNIRMLLAEVLEELGYNVIEAEDAAQGLAVLQSDRAIDLLITDVGLPGSMNGQQMAAAARAARPGLKILFITGYADKAAADKAQAGTYTVAKPFALDALANRIKTIISAG
jgi:PAS domain S-box-containing protein